MTNLFQPFDITVARPLKQSLARFANDLIENCQPEKGDMTSFLRLTQVIVIIDAVRVGSTITNCKVGF